MMKPVTLIRGAMLAVVAACSIAICACEETTEEKLENAGEKTGDFIEDTADGAEEGLEKTSEAVEDAGKDIKKGLDKLGEAFE